MGDVDSFFLAARRFAAACLIILIAVATAWAQGPTVDQLLTRLFTTEGEEPYELTSDFSGKLSLVVRGSRVTANARGSFREWRKAGEVRRRKVTIDRLDVPLLLRPFAGTLRRLIEEKVETQTESQETFLAHDVFMLPDLPGRQYALGGVHRSIVDDAISRYGKPEDKLDVATRRRIAHWLFTNPNMRSMLVRSGPPYAMRAVVDDAGHVYDLILYYDWGKIGTKITYTLIDSVPVWRNVVSDTVGDLSGVGRVEGDLALVFTNHCMNCVRAPSAPPRR
jgi:hypothetical protein